MSFSAGNSGNTAKAIDGIEGATSGAPVSLPSGYIGSPRPATLADANVTLIATSNPDMVMTPTVTRTITLASTSIPANYVVRIVNKSPSVTINVNASGGGLVAIVAGGSQMTVMSNIPSPTVPADWNTNSYGDAFGPGSSVDNAIVRFDGTTGKLIQNSGASIDDSGNTSATSFTATGSSSANGTMYFSSNALQWRSGTSGYAWSNTTPAIIATLDPSAVYTLSAIASSPCYYRIDNTTNGGSIWRLGYTGSSLGSVNSFDIYNQTSGATAMVVGSDSVPVFPQGIGLDDAAGQSALNYYATQTNTVSLSGATTTPTITYTVTRIGNIVTLTINRIPVTNGLVTKSGNGTLAISIPAGFRPTNGVWFHQYGVVGAANITTLWQISSGGGVAMHGNVVGNNIPDTSACGWDVAVSFTYCIVP